MRFRARTSGMLFSSRIPGPRLRPAFALLGAALLLAAPLAAQGRERYTPIGQAFTFDAPTFSTIPNGQTHLQDMVLSHGGWQYLGWWNQDRRLSLGRRRLPFGPWEILVFPDWTISGQDSHNGISLGICAADGTLHLAFDHHVDPLHYRVSVPGLVDDPEAFPWDPSVFGPILDTLDPASGPLDDVTYPRFLMPPDGGLQFSWREFTSGNGRQRLVDYDPATGSWSGDRVIVERTGAHDDPLGGSSSSRNPYFNRMEYDAFGTLHLTWTWREAAPVPYNRDIAYAWSDDGGWTWYNTAFELVGDPASGLFITGQSPVRMVELGAEWGLMNDQGQVVDAAGRVHVVMYHKDQPDTVVSYGNLGNSHYNHYWWGADGAVRSFRLASMGDRPKLFVDAWDRLILAWRDGWTLRLDAASPWAGYEDWSTVYSRSGSFGSSAQGDRPWFAESGILTLPLQDAPPNPGDVTDLGAVEVVVADFLPAPDPLEEAPRTLRLDVEQDAYVRDGAWADTNFGQEAFVELRSGTNPGDTRLGLLRLDLRPLAGGGPLERAILRLSVDDAGPAWDPAFVEARRCAEDAWSETGVTWNDRPLPSGAALSGRGRPAVLVLDLTELVAAELALGGERLTLELSLASVAPGAWVRLGSRESASPPLFLVDQRNALEPVADTYVRNGLYADTNYSGEDRVLVKEVQDPDYQRVAYLRFDLEPLRGTGEILEAVLEMELAAAGELPWTSTFAAQLVADDSWDEASLTWNTRPAPGARLDLQFGRPRIRWDLTEAVLAELAGDGFLSLALQGERAGGERIVHLWSREAADPALRPRLLLRYAE